MVQQAFTAQAAAQAQAAAISGHGQALIPGISGVCERVNSNVNYLALSP